MIFYRILFILFSVFLIQKDLQALYSGAGAVIKSGSSSAQKSIPYINSVTPNLIASKLGFSSKSSGTSSIEIPEPLLRQYQNTYKEAFKEASQWANQYLERPIEIQRPFNFPKEYKSPFGNSVNVNESKAFLDLQLVNLLKNKTINNLNFLQAATALAAMYGFYTLIDFLNNLYENNTLLMWAVEEDNENLVEILLTLGVDIHKQNSDGNTAMLLAAQKGNSDIVQLLIDNIKDRYADNPELQKEQIHKLIEAKNKSGETPLLEVILYGNFYGQEKTKDGQLKVADEQDSNRIDIITTLLDNGANVKAKDKYGDTILFILAKKMSDISDQVVAQSPNTEVSFEKQNENIAVLQEIFDIFASEAPSLISQTDSKGESLLSLSVDRKNLYLFNYLKDKINPKDIMQADNQGQNILIKAVDTKDTSLLNAVINLLESNKNIYPDLAKLLNIEIPFVIDRNGKILSKTALDQAVMEKAPIPMITLLIKKGSTPTEAQFNNIINRNNLELVNLYLDNLKQGPSVKNLMNAFSNSDIAIFKALFDSKKLSEDIKNTFIKYALPVSLKKQDAQKFNLLLSFANQNLSNGVIVEDIIKTENPEIINEFINSPNVTDTMRKNLLKHVADVKSANVVKAIVDNPRLQKISNEDLRLTILENVVKNVKVSGSTSKVMTQQDFENDPILRVLLAAWAPKYQDSWGNWFANKFNTASKIKTPKELYEENKASFDKELALILQKENKNREYKSKKEKEFKDLKHQLNDEEKKSLKYSDRLSKIPRIYFSSLDI